MIEKHCKEGYVIEVHSESDRVTYVSNVQRRNNQVMNCSLVREEIPGYADIFATKEEATQLRDQIRKTYSKAEFGFTYKIRFIRTSLYYEFPKY